jgi:undecaprenyl pyrophosphate synthase
MNIFMLWQTIYFTLYTSTPKYTPTH